MAEQPTVFRYEKPDMRRPRHIVKFGRTESLFGTVNVLRSGGENKLHSHPNMDGFWFVLSGKVRFYTTGDEVVATLGRHEGIMVPSDYPYWFEGVGDEDAELLQVEAFKQPGEVVQRVLHAATDLGDNYEMTVVS